MDRRSDAQCIDMGRRIGDGTVYRITGNKADPFYVYSELLWFKQNQPALYEKTRWILQANGYLNLRLTGSFTLDATHASITQCYDVLHRCWSSELLQPYGVPGRAVPAGQPAGRRDRNRHAGGCGADRPAGRDRGSGRLRGRSCRSA